MSTQQLDKNFVLGADLRGARMFGGGAVINPEGRFACVVIDVGWVEAKSGNGRNFVFRCRSIEEGFLGLELTHQVYFENDAIRAGLKEIPGMSEETKRNMGMAKDKAYSAFRSLGYDDAKLFAGLVPIGAGAVAAAPRKDPTGMPVILLRVTHKLDDVVNPRSKKAILLKNGKPKHRVQQDTVAVNEIQYGSLPRPDRAVPSEAQKMILIEAGLDTGESEDETATTQAPSNVTVGSFGDGAGASFGQPSGEFGQPSGQPTHDAINVPAGQPAQQPWGGQPAAPAGYANGAPPTQPWGATGASMPPARA